MYRRSVLLSLKAPPHEIPEDVDDPSQLTIGDTLCDTTNVLDDEQ